MSHFTLSQLYFACAISSSNAFNYPEPPIPTLLYYYSTSSDLGKILYFSDSSEKDAFHEIIQESR
jgi:hypothetical protein